ncbi:MAG: isochorismate synthase [bacterium]|nr:isochorismate synthase [bacterium]
MSLATGQAPVEARRHVDPSGLACRELPASASADLLGAFATATAQRRFCWLQPDRDLAVVGLGAALVWRPSSRGERFAEAARWAAEVSQPPEARAAYSCAAPAGPILCGGFSFDPRPLRRRSRWAAFGAGTLVMPELLGVARNGEVRWLVTAERGMLAAATRRSLDLLRAASGAPADPARLVLLNKRSRADDDSYLAVLTAAREEIRNGTLHKVVPARQVTAGLAGSPGPGAVAELLRRLAGHYPGATTFAVGCGRLTLLGATPELLIRTRGGTVETDALAGSCPRGSDREQDAALARAMLASPKERREHDTVVEHLRRGLTSAGVALEHVPPEPQVRALAGIQHLCTPLRGTASTAPGMIFDLAGAVHPTPAVAGLPVAGALRFLRRHEPADRGWFAGPVGWTDLAGDGELCLALRSGLVDASSSEMSLFAGSGVLGESDPAAELAETDMKLDALASLADGGPPAERLGQ